VQCSAVHCTAVLCTAQCAVQCSASLDLGAGTLPGFSGEYKHRNGTSKSEIIGALALVGCGALALVGSEALALVGSGASLSYSLILRQAECLQTLSTQDTLAAHQLRTLPPPGLPGHTYNL
jgi:hypothetical protein